MTKHDGRSEASSPSEEEITAAQAQRLLRVGHTRLAQLLKEGILSFRISPLDNRVHLVKRSEVDALLLRVSQGVTVEQARKRLGVSNKKILALIQHGELPVSPNPLNTKQRLVDPGTFSRLLAEHEAQVNRQRAPFQNETKRELDQVGEQL